MTMSSTPHWGEPSPGRLVLFFVFTLAGVWTLLPWLTHYSLPLDVVEGLLWGQEWQWGYYKHPPLPSWLLHISFSMLGAAGAYLLSQLSIALTLLFVFLLGRRIFDTERAALGTLLLLGVYYFTWPTPEYNHNVAQMPIWAVAVYLFHRTINEGLWRDWLLLGFVVGLGLLTKYSIIMLLACMVIYMLTDRVLISKVVSPRPLAGLAVLFVVISPHVLWLINHEFLPFQYAQQRSAVAVTLADRLLGPLKWLLVQALDHLPVLLLLLGSGLLGRRAFATKCATHPEHARFLWILGLGPALLTAVSAGITGSGLRDMWGMPMWNLSGLLIVTYLAPPQGRRYWRRFTMTLLSYLLILTLAYGATQLYGDRLSGKPSRIGWPAQAMAAEMNAVWQRATACELKIIAGDYWLAGLVAYPLVERPSVFIDGNEKLAPWITPKLLRQQGALLIWRLDNHNDVPASLSGIGELDARGTSEFSWPRAPDITPLKLGWGIVLPESGC